MRLVRPVCITLLSVFVIGLLINSCSDTSTGPGNGGEPEPDPYSHTDQPGSAANDILADSNFTELVVEIDYMPGYEPDAEALDSLEAFLERRAHKEVTIMDPTEIESGGQDSYTDEEVRDLEEEHRDEFTENEDSETLAAYMIIVDGEFEEDSETTDVLGIAYYNTSNAFFGPKYDEVEDSGTSRYKVESTSYRHEFGHLFGLVNIDGSGTDMQENHQDEEHGHHCDNDECLMYYAMERSDVFEQILGDENVPELDQNCINDLQGNGGR
ncbi:MAG: hypothetical protein ACOC4S_00120 [Balneolaceae bacterium]